MPEKFAIIVGSGFADLVDDAPAQTVDTPYGQPSAPLYESPIGRHRVLTLMRHGDNQGIPAHLINYRANIAALKAKNTSSIIALNTVGVVSQIRDGGQIGIPDQLIDYTWGREHTFMTGGDMYERHIEFTDPFSSPLRTRLLSAAAAANVDCYDGGVYAATQGPRLETAAEVDRLERDGADYVGMTAMPEAVLAAELKIKYACIALVVNRAAGRGDQPIHDDVETNSAAAKALAMRVIDRVFSEETD
ncbi:MAG: S-methyl-5'-thioinosine phosphorylase [Gammaproteobacteria bacterium]|nr:S-methyl-5'-thioinosine phosphorylase [Gammaproteobacteria bacterium]